MTLLSKQNKNRSRYQVGVVRVMGGGNDDVAQVVEVAVEGAVEAEAGVGFYGIPEQDDATFAGRHTLVRQPHPLPLALQDRKRR